MATMNIDETSAVALLSSVVPRLRVHDVSPTISSELSMFVFHEAPTITPVSTHAEGRAATNRLTMNEHTGSHIDAPFHFDADGLTIDQVAADTLLLRQYRKYNLVANDHQPGDLIEVEHLRAAESRDGFEIARGDVAIIEVGWDRHRPGGAAGSEAGWWGANQPGLSPEACDYLADAGVIAVACDTAGCDVAVRGGEVLAGYGHTQAFLPRGILIIEGLQNLAEAPTAGLIVALPLKIAGGTGSPTRVLLLAD